MQPDLNIGPRHPITIKINMDNLDSYTSTGAKYGRHYDMINSLRNGIGRPQSLQVALTNRCNLKCVFCSVAERDLKDEWSFEDLIKAIEAFISIGIKTIEFSGGGEPTLYREFNELVIFCKQRGLLLGLITNGMRLKEISQDILSKFEWIRISMVGLDYQETIDLPDKFPDNVTIGMSYVVGQKEYQGKRNYWQSDYDQLMKIKEYALKYKAKFIRIVPECFSNNIEMEQIHYYFQSIFPIFGYPFIFQPKKQKQAEYCWMDSIKPWLDVSGYVFPCNSISLLSDAQRYFHPKYRICHWTEIEKYYQNRGKESLKIDNCDRCTFVSQNEIISELLTPIVHEEFV